MNRENKIHVFIIMALILAILFPACLFILIRSADQHFLDSAEILSQQIENLIDSNQHEKNALQDSLKEEYIQRAKALAYILEENSDIQTDYDELCKVAELLSIDEINVFGQDGLIAYSTVKEYVGFSIYSGG